MNGGWNGWTLSVSDAHFFSSSNSWKTLSEIYCHPSSFWLSICIQSHPTNPYSPQRISHGSKRRWTFCLILQTPILKKKNKKKTLSKKKWKNPVMISALRKMQSGGKNRVCSIEAGSKPRCQSGSGWGIKAGSLRTTMWDGICEHEKDLDGRFLDTLTHEGHYVVSKRESWGWFVYWTLKIKREVTPRTRAKIQQNTFLALTNPVHYS